MKETLSEGHCKLPGIRCPNTKCNRAVFANLHRGRRRPRKPAASDDVAPAAIASTAGTGLSPSFPEIVGMQLSNSVSAPTSLFSNTSLLRTHNSKKAADEGERSRRPSQMIVGRLVPLHRNDPANNDLHIGLPSTLNIHSWSDSSGRSNDLCDVDALQQMIVARKENDPKLNSKSSRKVLQRFGTRHGNLRTAMDVHRSGRAVGDVQSLTLIASGVSTLIPAVTLPKDVQGIACINLKTEQSRIRIRKVGTLFSGIKQFGPKLRTLTSHSGSGFLNSHGEQMREIVGGFTSENSRLSGYSASR